jgi:transposase
MKRRKHSKEFKLEAVKLARDPSVGFEQAAERLGIHPSMLYRWDRQLSAEGGDAFPGAGNRSGVEAELARLRRENAELRMETEILKKAAIYFAKKRP